MEYKNGPIIDARHFFDRPGVGPKRIWIPAYAGMKEKATFARVQTHQIIVWLYLFEMAFLNPPSAPLFQRGERGDFCRCLSKKGNTQKYNGFSKS
jgi:hypothetical protein